MLTENDLRSRLRTMVDAPPAPPERFAAVERRAIRTRRRRQSAAAGVAALAVLLAAAPAVLRDRDPVPPTAPAPQGLPRDIVLFVGGRPAILTSLDGSVAEGLALGSVRQPEQLPGGAIVGLRDDGVLLRIRPLTESNEPVVLGPATGFFAGLRPGDVWRVEAGDRYRVQRLSVDGNKRGREITLPEGILPVGEVAEGLVVEIRRDHPGQSRRAPGGGIITSDSHEDLAIADRSSGEVRRVLAEDVGSTFVAAGRIVWSDSLCSPPCAMHLLEADGRRRDVPETAPAGSFNSSLSPDGRWYARDYATTYDAQHKRRDVDLIQILDLDTGKVARLPYGTKSTVWSGSRLLFVTEDGRVGAYAAVTGELELSGRIPGHLEMVAGALDMLPST